MDVIRNITDVIQYIDGVKAVIFDLDDTLYSEKEYVRSGFCSVAKLIPCVKNAEIKLWNAFERNEQAIDSVLNSENIYSEELKKQCIKNYQFHVPNIKLYSGVKELLGIIRESGYKIGIITDGRVEGQKNKMESLQIQQFIDYCIITDELGGIEYRKPNELAFKIMAKRLEMEYTDMCYVGDNLAKDFIAPSALGMKCIWFRNENGIYYNSERE